ncbi:hypothetical protein Aph01nite_00140 [Acrocarpospora phusangensis]|uniref:Uncharacterized protein n=1 Tax=Acrocarpospora phusangensis TaxID=1070424 RepID=A0A919Q3K1_9ACTN|nr:hypothetical protein [Acrocarpospora phusangensis]GIH21704.1 hypothetical protein Aph01nite_00140 [Acrocarpospora phusangensis]
MRRTISVAAAVTIAAGLTVATPAAATATAEGVTARSADVHKKSRACSRPKGKKFNISWKDGVSSTTFYFNNHCRQTQRIRVWYASSGMKCRAITVRPGIKGSKKLHRIYYHNLMKVDFGKCPYWP